MAARPLPPAYGVGDGAKPPENRRTLPVATLHQLWQDEAGMNESEKQFSFTLAVSITNGRAKNQIPLWQYFLKERDEILRHKWIEAKNAGYDIGMDRAIRDWLKKKHALWAAAQDASKPPGPVGQPPTL
jgi:hypothetical protein